MDDLVIRGMNMPKSCDECRLFNESWCMALSVENWRKSYNKPPEGGRLPDCPLVPLPEGHGRLIDADVLMEIIRAHDYPLTAHFNSTDNGMFTLGIQQAVNESPTIVPAEGGADNEHV